MKKSLLVASLAAFTVANTAQANWYVQGSFGSTHIKSGVTDEGRFKKTVFEPRLSIGYKLADFRVALDYSHYNTVKERYIDENSEVTDTTIKIRALGLSAFYDFDINTSITPFIGARVALNRVSSKDVSSIEIPIVPNSAQTQRLTNIDSSSETLLGFGAEIGLNYAVTENFILLGAVEYNYLGKSGDVKVNSYGAKLGLRYNF